MSWDPIWEKVFLENEWGKYPSESVIRFVARNFYKRDRSTVRILEVGCGPGANIWYLSREGFQAYGIDGSMTAIQKAGKRLEMEGLSAQLCVGDILQLPYEDSFFDAVIDVECLCCNNRENTKKILKEIHRVMKPNGLFYSRTFSERLYIGRDLNETLEFESIPEGALKGKGFVRLVTRDEIAKLYGEYFMKLSIDDNGWTVNDGEQRVEEYVFIGADRK